MFYFCLPIYFLFSGKRGDWFWSLQRKFSILIVSLFFISFVVFPLYWGVTTSLKQSTWLPFLGSAGWVFVMFTGGARYRIKVKR
jgi:hypothetical protein